MSVKATYTCDHCGVTKGETNHWFAIRQLGTSSTILPHYAVYGFMDAGPDDWHLCGESCLTSKLMHCVAEISKADQRVRWAAEADGEIPLSSDVAFVPETA